MASLPFGLSVHHFINSVGADAGFAALIGLALLVLLYFAQARETATLRNRADEAARRVQELEDQLYDLAGHVAAIPEPEISIRAASPTAAAAAVGRQAVAGRVKAPLPFAPVGVGAPALASATRLIPVAEPAVAQPQPAPAAAPAAPGQNGAPAQGAEIGAPPPATVAGGNGGNGSSRQPVAAAAAPPAVKRIVQGPPGGSPGAGGPPRPSPAQRRPVPGAPGRPGAGQGSRPGGPARLAGQPREFVRLDEPPRRRSRMGTVLAGLFGVLVLAAIVVGLLVATGNIGSSTKTATTSANNAAASRRGARTAVFTPAKVIVTVLNGTDISGLAGRISNQLIAAGYRKGRVTNASSQSATSSVVEYTLPAYRPYAVHVADSLKLGAASVQPLDQNTKAAACQPGQPCTATVVVTVGSDLASQ